MHAAIAAMIQVKQVLDNLHYRLHDNLHDRLHESCPMRHL